ncbi:MAG: flagellar biosynthesis regulatory protein FlaF [Hyphomicrobiales bacterium]|nr:MAG: flagellar biosynthesis regulatory protein FlaF [Hyphomicrobiales bacterium]
MQQHATQAYQTTAKRTGSPRDLEANLLSKSATNLQRIRDAWDLADTELLGALKFNRKLWNVFLNSATNEDNPLPAAIRQNIANLGLFVLSHTIRLEAKPDATGLDVLININREVAAGLRASQLGGAT